MKFKRELGIIVSVILMLSLLVACEGKPESKLIGEWTLAEDTTVIFFTFEKGSKIEFYKNGNLDFMGMGSKYEIIDNKIKMISGGEAEYYEYELEDNFLTMYPQVSGLFSPGSISLKFEKTK